MLKKNFFLLLLLVFASTAAVKAGELTSLEGKEVDYQQLSASGQVVLFLWTTWCPYCLIQLDNISEQCFYPGVELVLVNSGEKRQIMENFLKNNNLPSCVTENIILDKDSTIAKKFSISGFPTFIFLKNGKYLTRSYYLNKDLIEKVY